MSDQTTNTASEPMLCIFCDNAVGLETSPEHILLDSLGGRKTTKWANCSVCNQSFGGTIDKSLPEQLRTLRNMFQMRSGSGQVPPGIKQVSTSSGTVNFEADGTPRPVGSKPFTAMPKADGGWELSFNVASEEQLRIYVPHAAAAMGMSEDRLWGQIEGREASLQTNYVGAVHSSMQCGGEEAVRSITKSGLALLATLTGTAVLRASPFASARGFVLKGDAKFLEQSTAMDARALPSPAYEHLVEAHGPMFNLIYVKSDAQGRTLAYFHLFNLFSWQIVLAPAGGPANVAIALASNPLDPAKWDGEVASKAFLDFDWLNTPDDTDRNETGLRRLSAIIELYLELTRKRTVGKIIKEVLGKYYTEGDQIEMDDKGKAALAELSLKLTTTLMQVRTEDKFTLTRF